MPQTLRLGTGEGAAQHLTRGHHHRPPFRQHCWPAYMVSSMIAAEGRRTHRSSSAANKRKRHVYQQGVRAVCSVHNGSPPAAEQAPLASCRFSRWAAGASLRWHKLCLRRRCRWCRQRQRPHRLQGHRCCRGKAATGRTSTTAPGDTTYRPALSLTTLGPPLATYKLHSRCLRTTPPQKTAARSPPHLTQCPRCWL